MTNRWTWFASERYSVDCVALLVFRAGWRLFCEAKWNLVMQIELTVKNDIAYISSFADFFRFINQPLRNHPQIVGLRDKYIGEMTTLRCHSHLSWDVILVSGVNKSRWKERRCRDCGDIVDWHLVEALQIDDELEEVEKFAHCISIFVWQKEAQYWDCSGLILSGESWGKTRKMLIEKVQKISQRSYH